MQMGTQFTQTLSLAQSAMWWFVIMLFGLIVFIGRPVQAQDLDTVWTRRFGGQGIDYANVIISTPDSNMLIGGATSSFGTPGNNGYLLLVNQDGDLIWQRSYGHIGCSSIDDVAITSDGNVLISGTSSAGMFPGDVYIAKLDMEGDTIWTNPLDGFEANHGERVIETSDGRYALIASGGSSAVPDVKLIMLNSEGDTLWTRGIGGPSTDYAAGLIETGDHRMVVAGSSVTDFSLPRRLFATAYSLDGDSLWFQSYGDTVIWHAFDITELDDGRLVIVGEKRFSELGSTGFLAQCISNTGDSLWTASLDIGDARGVSAYSSDAILVSGSTGSDPFLVRIGLDGVLRNVDVVNFVNTSAGFGAHVLLEESIYACGSKRELPGGDSDVLLAKIETPTSVGEEREEMILQRSFDIMRSFPNPFNNTLTISLEIPLHQDVTLSLYDLLGREVDVIHRGRLNSSTLNYTAPTTLSSGIYFLHAATSTHSALQKVILLK